MMKAALTYAQEHADDFRSQLHDLLRIPSISTDPAFRDQTRQAAEWLAEDLRDMGLTAELIDPEQTGRHPLVYAEWMGAGDDAPTVLVYGHYDVQPAVRADGWDSEPFEPVEREGKIYARGASDDKGQMFIHVKAVESILRTEGTLPVNVKFLIEGEEESGGEYIAHYIPAHPEKLAADVCVISDTSMATIEQPSIVSSLRGVLAMELHVTGTGSDLHSGMYGGTVHNPLQALAEIVAKLHDETTGKVAVPGFYEDVVELSDEVRATIQEWTEDDWRENTGAAQPWGETGYTLKERIGIRPTLEINGMAGGYYGDGFKTVLPANAMAKISCRLVANQDPDRIVQQIQAYLATITPPTVTSELIIFEGKPAAMVDIHAPAMQAAVRAYERGWGTAPNFEREGGSIPVVSIIQSELDAPVIMMGFGLHSDGLHGPNEHFTIEMFHRGIDTMIHFLYALTESE